MTSVSSGPWHVLVMHKNALVVSLSSLCILHRRYLRQPPVMPCIWQKEPLFSVYLLLEKNNQGINLKKKK